MQYPGKLAQQFRLQVRATPNIRADRFGDVIAAIQSSEIVGAAEANGQPYIGRRNGQVAAEDLERFPAELNRGFQNASTFSAMQATLQSERNPL
jgi:hypothetical protein